MKRLFLIFCLFILAGCATKQAILMPNKDIRNYKMAYIEILKIDEYNLGSAIISELAEIGIGVTNDSSIPVEMKIVYSYTRGWDLSPYLKSFQIVFTDAKDGSIVANIAYYLNGNWASSGARIKAAFNELRIKLGLPEK